MFGPVDLLHRIRRQLDMLARPPVPRGDDEIADVPVGVVGEEVLYMAKVAIRGVDVIAVYRGDAAQMRIAVAEMGLLVCCLTGHGYRNERWPRKRHADGVDAEIRGAPIWIQPIIVVQLSLHLLRHRLIFARIRACL